ncbi:hypothetical protein SAMN06295885_0568 [Rathayibacter oskolensis]|uniref:Cellulose binding domain-containing protein n=1 Tax=Rathayibacter oskolensis TaxID=1891671 RepID=A0A1X7N334_9MICO|nr:hypothetical protein [Rathayibacter oskolensis]SMH31246.1 hypothetical protein SAMN06295885_0568 [Rathayibacter oskolensis]
MRRRLAAVALAVLATTLTGCAPELATQLPAGVSVSIRQNRDDYGPRRIEVLVDNAAATPLDLWEVRLDSPAFAEPSWTSEPVTIRPGTTTALRLQLAGADCGAADPGAAVRLAFTRGDVSGTATVTPDDPFDSIDRIHGEDCLAEAVAGVVEIAPADAISVVDEDGTAVAHLRVVVTPTGAPGAVTIDGIARTILLRPASGAGTWPVGVRLDSGSPPLTLDLPIVPNNCNTHTVSEDKRGTFLPIAVAVEGGATGVVSIGVDDGVRGALYDYIASDYCGWE